MQALAVGYRRIGQVDQALVYARRWASLEPLQEPAHRCLMRLYAEANDPAAALQQYARCAALLAEELDALPAAETTTLYAQIKSGKPLTPRHRATQSAGQRRSPPWPRQPTPFIGRTGELAQIADALANPACRLLTLLGPGGIGKSPAVVQLCRLVDGNPLALELAAGWTKMMPPALIVLEVQRELGFLQTETQDVPPRHRSRAIVFEHSWRLLANAKRNILRPLAVFVGSFDYAAAHAVTGATLPQLATLIDKSWIRATPTGCMALHELIRQFAAGKLAGEHQLATGEAETAVYQRHSQWYGQLLSQMEPLLKGKDQVTALQRLRSERDNIWAAWNWAAEHGVVAILQQASFALWYAADTLGWLLEAIDAYSAAVDAIRPALGGSALPSDPLATEKTLTVAAMLTYQAILYTRCGRLAQAQQNCDEALAYLHALPSSPPQLICAFLFWRKRDGDQTWRRFCRHYSE